MPEGVPPAARRPEPQLPAPSEWPFGEEFPRTCGAGRLAGGALFWTDFLYDDHGATGMPVGDLKIQAPPPRHLRLSRRARGPQRRRHLPRRHRADRDPHLVAGRLEHAAGRLGADRAVHLRHRPRASRLAEEWPAGAGVRSAGIDMALLVSGSGAALIDLTTAGHDAGRAQRRYGVAVVSGAGSAFGAGTGRHLDGAAGRGAGQRRGRRVRRRARRARRAARATQRLQRRVSHQRAGAAAPELLVRLGPGRGPDPAATCPSSRWRSPWDRARGRRNRPRAGHHRRLDPLVRVLDRAGAGRLRPTIF